MTLRALHWAPADACWTPSQPTILLVHGLGDTADIWRPLMEHWHPSAATLAVDLPGHGRSPHLLPDGYTCAGLTDQVAQVLIEHGISRPVLVGHSLGARICANLATRPELRARSTVLVDIEVGGGAVGTSIAAHIDAVTAGSPTLDGLCDLFFDRLPLAERDAISRVVPAMVGTSAGHWHVPLDPAIKRLLTPPVGDDLWRTLSQVAGPVSVIRGAYSAVLSQAAAQRIAATIRCQPVLIRVIEMAGHAIPIEQPVQLARALEACLAGIRLSE